MPSSFRDRRRVEFYETDMAGIVHFSNFFRYMESTEHAFFRSLGLSLHREEASEKGAHMSGWARVRAQCEYREPLRYMDEVEIELSVRSMNTSSLGYDFVFRRLGERHGSSAPTEVASGSLQVVHVRASAGGRMKASPMPAEVRERIEIAPR